MAGVSFGERLAARVAERESQIVLGLDPDPRALWPEGRSDGGEGGPQQPPAARAGAAVARHCMALIDAAGPACVAVKPQLACFERLGVAGRRALGEVVSHAREAGLLVVADGKRGDIDVSARAYAESLFGGVDTPFGTVEGLGADMATVSPLLGADAVEPFVEEARRCRAGVLVLVRTSNPGAGEIQDLLVAVAGPQGTGAGNERGGAPKVPQEGHGERSEDPGGGAAGAGERQVLGRSREAVWERLAELVDRLGDGTAGGEEGVAGISDVGAVVGATVPEHLRRARELMPNAVLLLPGVGAQGGRVEDLGPAFEPGRAGGLVSASRSIAGAHRKIGGSPAEAARAEAERLRVLAWRLSEG